MVKVSSIITLQVLLSLATFSEPTTSVSECEVLVGQPWPMPYLFVPENSTVIINCTNTSSAPLWSIDLGTDPDITQLQFASRRNKLNANGVYELPPVEAQGLPSTIRLLINDTSMNNQTVIICDGENEQFQTTLYVYEPDSPFNLTVSNMSVNFMNISWSQALHLDVELKFAWMVSDGSRIETLLSNTTYYMLTAPKDAPACQVYNFSVTATYVGATYTGAACIPHSYSQVLSTMLPSLPTIERLEETIWFTLSKLSKELLLNITFEAATSCEQYPVLNYTLEVKHLSPWPDETMSLALNHSTSVQSQHVSLNINLSENAVYSFRVLVSNAVGSAPTKNFKLFTTDVRMVTASIMEKDNTTVLVHCDYINGSNADGCQIVLVGECDNITTNITRSYNSFITLNITFPPLSYYDVFAYDIESDGSVGSLAVPGVLVLMDVKNVNTNMPCLQNNVTTTYAGDSTLIWTISGGCVGAIVVLILFGSFIIFLRIRSKKAIGSVQPLTSDSSLPDVKPSECQCIAHDQLQNQGEENFYDQPLKLRDRERTTGDGAEYEKTKHIKDQLDTDTMDDVPTNTYSELTEETHHYFTLESSRPPRGIDVTEPDSDALALPPPYRPDTPTSEPPPAYQELSLAVVMCSSKEKAEMNENVTVLSSPSRLSLPSGSPQATSETLL